MMSMTFGAVMSAEMGRQRVHRNACVPTPDDAQRRNQKLASLVFALPFRNNLGWAVSA